MKRLREVRSNNNPTTEILSTYLSVSRFCMLRMYFIFSWFEYLMTKIIIGEIDITD